jgi:hypothetical protein
MGRIDGLPVVDEAGKYLPVELTEPCASSLADLDFHVILPIPRLLKAMLVMMALLFVS